MTECAAGDEAVRMEASPHAQPSSAPPAPSSALQPAKPPHQPRIGWRIANPRLRRLRAFAQCLVAFYHNRRQSVELGHTIGRGARLQHIGAGKSPRRSEAHLLGHEATGGHSQHALDASAGWSEGRQKPWWVSLPTSIFQRTWEVFMVLPILYVASITPFRVFFEEARDVRAIRGREEGVRGGLSPAGPWS